MIIGTANTFFETLLQVYEAIYKPFGAPLSTAHARIQTRQVEEGDAASLIST